jgi:phosphoribosyl-AMP cyclohydrolase
MSETEITEVLSRLKFDDQGLIPAIVQDAATGRVLTLAYMNREDRAALTERAADLVLESQPSEDVA